MRADSPNWEALLGQALLSPDPADFLADRGALGSLDRDGLQMAALLVVKLRFERLIAASSEAARLFEQDASAFAALFKRYHQEVAPTSPMPADERDLFESWLAGD